jgi:hypothetical protein
MDTLKKRWRWLLLLAPIALVTLWPAFRTHAQTSHSATLTWTYMNATQIPVATLTYQDTTVAAGSTYCYQVYAVDAKGNQSTPSNQVTATIMGNPAPPTGLAVATN